MTTAAQDLPLEQCASPSDEAAVAALIAGARKSGAAIYPIGGGTSLNYGLRPVRPGIGLALCQMNRVLDHPADDLTITVEAGLTLAALNRHLATKRQWLPIDAPQSTRATVGGIVATSACGPRRFARGTIGDYLIGFRAVNGCGEAFSGGGRVVKNAAGYNLPRLMAGSLGTLGVLTQLTFMVRPLPSHSALVICDVHAFQQAECLLAALGRSRTAPMIVELLAGPARPDCPMPALPAGHPRHPPAGRGSAAARLVIGFEGGAAEVQGMAGVLCEEWRALGADGLTTVTGAGVDAVWNWLSEAAAVLQINVLPSRLVETVEHLAAGLPGWPLQAHAGNGVVLAYGPAESGPCADFTDLVRNVRRPMVAAVGGHLTVLAAPAGAELGAAEVWGPPRPGAALMRSIQQRFDPAGILNPGRFAW